MVIISAPSTTVLLENFRWKIWIPSLTWPKMVSSILWLPSSRVEIIDIVVFAWLWWLAYFQAPESSISSHELCLWWHKIWSWSGMHPEKAIICHQAPYPGNCQDLFLGNSGARSSVLPGCSDNSHLLELLRLCPGLVVTSCHSLHTTFTDLDRVPMLNRALPTLIHRLSLSLALFLLLLHWYQYLIVTFLTHKVLACVLCLPLLLSTITITLTKTTSLVFYPWILTLTPMMILMLPLFLTNTHSVVFIPIFLLLLLIPRFILNFPLMKMKMLLSSGLVWALHFPYW